MSRRRRNTETSSKIIWQLHGGHQNCRMKRSMKVRQVWANNLAAAGPLENIGQRSLTFRQVPRVILGGLPIAALDRHETAKLIVESALGRPRGYRPLIFTSANGEVVSLVASDPDVAKLFGAADLI